MFLKPLFLLFLATSSNFLVWSTHALSVDDEVEDLQLRKWEKYDNVIRDLEARVDALREARDLYERIFDRGEDDTLDLETRGKAQSNLNNRKNKNNKKSIKKPTFKTPPPNSSPPEDTTKSFPIPDVGNEDSDSDVPPKDDLKAGGSTLVRRPAIRRKSSGKGKGKNKNKARRRDREEIKRHVA